MLDASTAAVSIATRLAAKIHIIARVSGGLACGRPVFQGKYIFASR